MPNQRLRMVLSFYTEAGHEVAHDFLKDRCVEPVPNELPLPFSRHEVRRLQHTQVVRYGGKRHRELLGDLPGGPVLLSQQLEDPAPRGVSEGTKKGIVHRKIFIQVSKYVKNVD